ncbi:MAG: restriction endonuclease [Verrucomicrobiales bacterium]|nr:restriction endonuclease [Verrucomicrobiales bacterium]
MLRASDTAPAAPHKPLSIHERIQAIDVDQMVKVMRAVFERQGYHPLASPESGSSPLRDFALEKDGEKTLVACRPAVEPRVGLQGVQEFADRMGSAGIAKGLLLAVKGYTFEARSGAASRGITILDGPEVVRLLEDAQASTDAELAGYLSGPSIPTPPNPGAPSLKLAKHG